MPRPFVLARRAALAVGVSGLALLVALTVDDLSFIFSLTGATASTMISFILPGAVVAKIGFNDYHEDDKTGWRRRFSRAGPIVLVTLGVIFMVVATTVTILDKVRG
jgi:amino acid permease